MNGCTKRIPDRAGWVGNGSKRVPCRWCQKPPDQWGEDGKYRRTFCSEACVHEHKLRTQPNYAAEQVLKRDRGICCQCGLDTVALRDRLLALRMEAACRVVRSRDLEVRCHHPDQWGTYDCGHDDCIRSRAKNLFLYMQHARWILEDHEYFDACLAAGIPQKRILLKSRLWEMDHIVPVVEGGADCGLENLRTLCWACHARETAALAKRRAEKRKASK